MKPGQCTEDYWKPEKAIKIKADIWKDTEGKSPDFL